MPLHLRDQIWQSLEEGAGKRCSECAPTPGSFATGLLPARSLTGINEKWVSEGWSCAGRGSSPGTATVAGLV